MKAPIDLTPPPDVELKLRKPKILLFDIETAANVGAFWRNPWQTSIIRTIQTTYMLSWSAKWLNGKQITRSLPDYKGYKAGLRDDKALVTELHALWEQADVLVAHNGNKFDVPYSKGRFLINGLPPPKLQNYYDTRAAAKRHLGLTSNKLDDIARLLNLGTKIPIHYEVWEGCEANDPKAWALMTKYNAHDTRLLEKVYLAIRPFDSSHPNVNAITGQEHPACPTCGCTDVWARGWGRFTKTGRRREYNCNGCGHRFSGKHSPITIYR